MCIIFKFIFYSAADSGQYVQLIILRKIVKCTSSRYGYYLQCSDLSVIWLIRLLINQLAIKIINQSNNKLIG